MRRAHWYDKLLKAFGARGRPIARRVDADFGDVWLDTDKVWRASLRFPPTGTELSIFIFGATEDGPTLWHRQQYRELLNRYRKLRSDMEAPLAQEYEAFRRDWEMASLPLSSPAQVWEVAHLARLAIHPEAFWTHFSFDHDVDWENADHGIVVDVKDWRVAQVSFAG